MQYFRLSALNNYSKGNWGTVPGLLFEKKGLIPAFTAMESVTIKHMRTILAECSAYSDVPEKQEESHVSHLYLFCVLLETTHMETSIPIVRSSKKIVLKDESLYQKEPKKAPEALCWLTI